MQDGEMSQVPVVFGPEGFPPLSFQKISSEVLEELCIQEPAVLRPGLTEVRIELHDKHLHNWIVPVFGHRTMRFPESFKGDLLLPDPTSRGIVVLTPCSFCMVPTVG
jgi:hypothetical protein